MAMPIDSPKLFFTADLHFGHKLLSTIRGFEHTKVHDEFLIQQWNAVVPDHNANVYVVGDFSFHSAKYTSNLVRRLNGTKFLIRGNHDRQPTPADWEFIKDIAEIKVADQGAVRKVQHIVMCHYAMRVWNKSHYGAWMLHGHSHGKLAVDTKIKSIDVGIDAHSGMCPLSYHEVKAILAKHGQEQVDQHGRRR